MVQFFGLQCTNTCKPHDINIHNTYLYHRQVSEPALQATSDSKHRHSLYVFVHHNVFSVQTAKANNISLIATNNIQVLIDNKAIN